MGFPQRQYQIPVIAQTGVTPEVSVDQTQDVQGVLGLNRAARSWRAAFIAAAVVLNTNVDSTSAALTTQPDTYVQDVQGVRALAAANRRFASTAFQARDLYYQSTNDLTSPPVADTWMQDVQGTRALKQGNAAFAQRVAQVGALYWENVDLSSGVQPIQPDTYVQDVQGIASIGARARVWQRNVLGMQHLWRTPEDVTTQPDTWTQDVQGPRSISLGSRSRVSQVVQQANLWQTLPEDANGTVASQNDTWPQDVQGVRSIGATNRTFAGRAVQTRLYWNLAQDPPPAVVVDQWTQDVQGTRSFKAAQQRYTSQASVLNPLLWETPEDVSGPLDTQPDTWTQDVQGTRSLRGYAQAFTQRSVGTSLYWEPTQDLPITVQPDTWTQPIVGTTGLRNAQRSYQSRVAITPLLWQTPEDVTILGVQPDTWVQDVQGVRSLTRTARAFTTLAVQAQALYHNTNDIPLGVQPDTWTQDVQGVGQLRQGQRTWTQRVGKSTWYWQSQDLSNGALVVQPSTWVQEIVGVRSLRIAQRQVSARTQASSFLWQTLPEDLTSATPIVHLVKVINEGLALANITGETRAILDVNELGTALILTDGDQTIVDVATRFWRLNDVGPFFAFDTINPGNTNRLIIQTTGTTFAQARLIDDKLAASINFDGVDHGGNTWTRLSANVSIGSIGTIQFWMMPSFVGGSTTIPIINDTNGYFSFTATTISVQFVINGTLRILTSNTPVVANTVYLLSATYDGSTFILYVNGVEANRTSGLTGALSSGARIVVGGPESVLTAIGFTGNLADLTAYSVALSAGQIYRYYNSRAVAVSATLSNGLLSSNVVNEKMTTSNITGEAFTHPDITDIDLENS